ncbi:hypothetical protein ACLBWP_16920 [Microbacterium sp. M1A1_1b]
MTDDTVTHDTTTDPNPDPTTPDQAVANGRRGRRVLLITAVAVVVVAAVAAVVTVRSLSAAPGEAVPATVPVAISVGHVPTATKIGVVITLGDGEGSEWDQAAQGARVAERRLALGGTHVELVTRNDGGTTDGARAAVQALVDVGVSGIVVASSGAHVSGATAAAAKAGVPVVLPYAASSQDAWSTAPSDRSVAAAMTTALGGARSPLLVDLGGGAPSGLRLAHVLDAADSTDTAALASTIATRTGATPTNGATADAQASADAAPTADSDAVVVSGSAARQGALVAALQAADVSVPVVLTPDATSPAFGSALATAGGSLSGTFRTVGVAADDARALTSDAEGRAMSAFLGGVRVLANDGDAENLTGDQPFAAVAGAADARSHDAVVALVRAVGAARSTTPAKVTDALARQDLDAADGIAGPALDFRRQSALSTPATVLAASSQPLGLRPTSTSDDTASLVWFADSAER